MSRLTSESNARLAFAGFLLLGAAAAGAWYVFASTQYLTYEIHTHDSVSGLIADAPVEYHGVDVGRVKSVELVDPHSVRILLKVERSAPVTVATAATITTRGLAARGYTGYTYVDLEDAGGDSRRLFARPGEDYPVIPTTQSKMASLDTAIGRMDENMQRITERMNEVLDANTVSSLRQSADNLQRVTKTLADNNARLNALIVNGERASRQLQPLLTSTNEMMSVLESQILPETHRALADLDNLNRQLQPLVASSSDTLTAMQTQVLPEVHKTLTDVDELSASLSGFAKQVKRDPSVIARGVAPRPLGPGER